MARANLDVALGEVVRRLRLERGLTQEALAHAARLQTGNLSRLENGRGNPRLATLEALAAALEVEPHELLAAAEQQRRPKR